MSQHLENTISKKEVFIRELDEVYSLIATSRMALQHEGCNETDSIADVLYLATNNLFELILQEKEVLKTLEAKQQGGES